MSSALRVDPARLRTAAAAQAEVGTFVSSMSAGQSMAGAADAVSGLVSGAAAQFVATVLDRVAEKVGGELSKHSENLSTAADRYHQADEDLGRRLRRIAG